MRAARAVVFPSLWYEGQPLTVLEAQASGTPVIVSDICAGRESVENGVSGLWFASNDVVALAASLRQLQDDATVTRMARASYRRFWAAAPTVEKHIAGLLEIYEGMLERKTGQ